MSETEQKREPLECWIGIGCGLLKGGQSENPEWGAESASALKSDCENEMFAGQIPTLFREVIKPEVKERPDSEGVWWIKGDVCPRMFYEQVSGDGRLYCPQYEMFADELKDAEWIKVQNPHGE